MVRHSPAVAANDSTVLAIAAFAGLMMVAGMAAKIATFTEVAQVFALVGFTCYMGLAALAVHRTL